MKRRLVIIGLFARILLGSAFLWAGSWKLLNPHSFIGATEWVSTIGLNPADLGAILPKLEIVVGACLLLGLYTRLSALLSILLLLGFIGTIVAVLFAGVSPETCGCFGHRILDSGGPWLWITRNLVLIGLAVLTPYPRGGRCRTLYGRERNLCVLRDTLLGVIRRGKDELLTCSLKGKTELISTAEVEEVGDVEPVIRSRNPDTSRAGRSSGVLVPRRTPRDLQ